MTPIQGRWYLISSGSTGYFSNSDKISGTTFDGNNEHFLLCMCVTFFLIFFLLYLHPPAAVIISWKNESVVFCIWGSFGRESPRGAPLPRDTHRSWAGRGRLCTTQLLLRKALAGGRCSEGWVRAGTSSAQCHSPGTALAWVTCSLWHQLLSACLGLRHWTASLIVKPVRGITLAVSFYSLWAHPDSGMRIVNATGLR